MSVPSRIDTAVEVELEMSDREVARVWQAGYTESATAESVANVASVLMTNCHVARLAGGPAARSRLTGGPTSAADIRNGSRE